MKKYSLNSIVKCIKEVYKIKGNRQISISDINTPLSASPNSLTFIDEKNVQYLFTTKAGLIICNLSLMSKYKIKTNQCCIFVKKPKLVFLRIANNLFAKKIVKWGIDPTAYIHPKAIVDKQVFIGPFSYIGRCIIGKNTVLYGHNHIYDDVHIGKNVIIHAGAVIGGDGFGYVENEKCEFENFPQIGKVIIEDKVEIGANSCIDRGALTDTIIKYGVKIDNLVHIGHNTIIGKNTLITAHVIISGSTIIGDHCYFAPNSSTSGHLTIGKNVFIGTGSVVTKNIPAGQTWVGSPAKPLQEFKALQNQLKKLSN